VGRIAEFGARLLALVTERPVPVLLGVALATAFFATRLVDPATGAARLAIDTSVGRLLPEGDPTQLYYESVRHLFGSDETLLVALVADDVFTRENLEAVRRITDRIGALPGVHHVVSLSTALNIRESGGDLDIEPFLSEMPGDAEGLARVRREALENPIYAGNLVSLDGRAAALLVYFLDLPEAELARLDAEIARIAEEERGGAQVRITGSPHIKVATGRIIVEDLGRILPISFGLIALIALLSFRSLRGLLIPVTSMAVALVWTLGTVAWLGYPLNLLTAIVPPLVITIGFAYVVHVQAEHLEVLRERIEHGRGPEGAVAEALRQVALPLLLTVLTTVAGFLSLLLNPIGAIREVGAFSSLGTVAAMLAAFTVVPAVLQILPTPRVPPRSAQTRLDDLFERLARFDVRHRRAIFALVAVVSAVSVGSIPLIRVNNGLISTFPDDHPVREDFERINAELGGSNPLYIVVETDTPEAFKEPVNLHALEELQDWLEAQPEVGSTTSLVEYLKLINRGFHGNDPAHLEIPESKRLVTQLLFFGANDELESFVDSRYQRTSVLVRSTVVDSGALADLIDRIEARLETLPEHLKARVTGNTVVVARAIDEIASGQATSMGSGFLLIYALLAALFTSLRMGFVALLPNLVPVAVYFGVIGFSGIELNTTNALLGCIILGIAVDDTIHYLVRFNAEARRAADPARGAIRAFHLVARPVAYTSLALALGFAVLGAARMTHWQQFGVLGAVIILFAWLVEATFSVALASGLRVVTLWEVLTLDLGEDPQRSIPIFRGLSARQARVVALTTQLETHPKGNRLFREGEEGGFMYVVIDGELSASLEQAGVRKEFSRHRRGHTVGEVALSGGRRTADVDVVEDARLLRLDEEKLARLSRYHPRIASVLLGNLNEILAERVRRTEEVLRA
jgi:predicted RND superfamily exporter protein